MNEALIFGLVICCNLMMIVPTWYFMWEGDIKPLAKLAMIIYLALVFITALYLSIDCLRNNVFLAIISFVVAVLCVIVTALLKEK